MDNAPFLSKFLEDFLKIEPHDVSELCHTKYIYSILFRQKILLAFQ